MKKLLVFALCMFIAGVASAGSIQWNISLGKKGFIADSNGDAMTGTLYFLLTDTANSLSDAVDLNKFADTLESSKLGSMELTDGKNTAVNTVTKSNTVLTPDTTYSFSLIVFDTANKQFYIASAIEQKAYDEAADIVTATQVTFNQTQVGSSYAANWSPTAPVPEPSTAALALAGLALLLKRRKA